MSRIDKYLYWIGCFGFLIVGHILYGWVLGFGLIIAWSVVFFYPTDEELEKAEHYDGDDDA